MSKFFIQTHNVLVFSSLLATLILSVNTGSPSAQESSDGIVNISREDCSRLIKHTPSDDVTYTPGVTKRGKKVVSAYLNAQPIVLPEIIKIPIVERQPLCPVASTTLAAFDAAVI
ncbi:hypothetical protein [Kiloniella sp.]|uniref:hypothetical protein n=1 Tax=Kiloniella sp. TaxID=1938587 RepID=UPI003B024CC8